MLRTQRRRPPRIDGYVRRVNVDTEHLLLEVLAHGENAATVALGKLGVDRAGVERMVDELVPNSERVAKGPRVFSPLAKKTHELALREALRLGHNYIGYEHFVLAHARMGREGVAGQILADQGVTYEGLKAEVLDALRAIT